MPAYDRPALGDVGARGEGPLAAVYHDRPGGVVRGSGHRGLVDLVLDLRVQRVDGWPVEPDRADSVVDLPPHEFAHGCVPGSGQGTNVR